MLKLPQDRTLPLLVWLILLSALSFGMMESIPVLAPAETNLVDINQAKLADLMVIPRLSIKTAKAILAYRDENGGIRDFDELKKIKGIGPKALEKLKAKLKIF